ncbi:MAG: hypothetical protein Tsb0020_49010 [Haliangiales bacterium]
MSVKETPLATVKRIHGSKDALIDALAADLAKQSDDSKDEIRQRLFGASNKKLLRLHDALARCRDKYGSKEGLVEAVSKAKGHGNDQDYANKLSTLPVTRLLDMARAR